MSIDYFITLCYKMINTKKFTNNLQARYDELLDDPLKWGMMRNLAYASIRDDVEKIVKQTNENSADVFINAENLIQNLKGHKINQYIDAGQVTQEINLTEMGQLNQVLMNTELFQKINIIKRETVVKRIEKLLSSDLTLFLNNKYAAIIYLPDEGNKYINISFPSANKLKEYLSEFANKYGIDHEIENIQKTQNNQGKVYKLKHKNYSQTDAIDSTVDYLIYEVDYGQLQSLLMILVNIDKYKIRNELQNSVEVEDNLFGGLIGNRKKLSNFLGVNFTEQAYNQSVGKIVKKVKALDKNNKFTFKPDPNTSARDLLFGKLEK